MLIEGYIDYAGTAIKEPFEKVHFDHSLDSGNSFFGVCAGQVDNYNSYLIACYTQATNKCRSLSNVSNRDLHSFKEFENLLHDSANPLRIGIWYADSQQEIYLTQDLFGTIPLYYIHVPDSFLAISTNLSALVQKKCIREFLAVNDDMLANYLGFGLSTFGRPFPESFYKHIQVAPPGHILKLTRSGAEMYPYVRFSPEKWSHLSRPSDYHDAVRHIFRQAVARTVGGDEHIVSSHLSGGLDSSSISCMFRDIFPARTLQTFCHVSDGPSVDDSPYVTSVVNKIGSVHHDVFQSTDDFGLIKRHTPVFGEPEILTVSSAPLTTIIPLARDQGCTLLLRGNFGDSVIGSGNDIIDDLFDQKDWKEFQRFLEKKVNYSSMGNKDPGWSSYTSGKKKHILLQNYLYRTAGELRGTSYRKLWSAYLEINQALGIDYSYFLRRFSSNYLSRIAKTGARPPLTILKDELIDLSLQTAAKTSLSASLRRNLPKVYKPDFDGVFTSVNILAHQQQFTIGQYYGIEKRSVFADKDLFELCMIVPKDIKYGDGIGRAHMRNAMTGILPELVRNRGDKAHAVSAHGQKITLRLYNQASAFLYDSSLVWQYVDRSKFATQVTILKNNKIPYAQKSRSWFHITRTIALALWLEWRHTIVNQVR